MIYGNTRIIKALHYGSQKKQHFAVTIIVAFSLRKNMLLIYLFWYAIFLKKVLYIITLGIEKHHKSLMSDALENYRYELSHALDEVRSVYIRLHVSVEGRTVDAKEALLQERSVCLVGVVGSGKTTVLRHVIVLLADLKDQSPPIFVPMREVPMDLSELSAHSLAEMCAYPKPPKVLLDQLACGVQARVLLDGLDEMVPSARSQFKEALSRWKRDWLGVSWIMSSRPHYAHLAPEGATILELLPLDDSQVEEYLAKHFHERKPGFGERNIEQVTALRTLARNPLLLSLISRLSVEVGAVPSSRVELYSSCVDILLRSWDKSKGIAPAGWHHSIDSLRSILGQVALDSLTSNRTAIDASDLARVVAHETQERGRSAPLGVLQSSFLVQTGPAHFEFVHESFKEYFAAVALSQLPPEKVVDALRISASTPLLEFLANLSSEPKALVATLVESGEMSLAFRFLEVLPAERQSLRWQFLVHIARRLGIHEAITPAAEDRIKSSSRLLELWNWCKNSKDPRDRGEHLESFVEGLFGAVFEIVSRDRLTDFGEIDLVCEPRQTGAFWGRWPSDFFVECKNNRDNSPVSDVNEFIGKASVCCARLGFFVSMSGFSSFAIDSMRSTWGKPGVPDTVWVTGTDLGTWLKEGESEEAFLKRVCRRANYGRE